MPLYISIVLLCQFSCVIIQLVGEEEGKSIQVASQSRLDAIIPTRLDGGIIVLKNKKNVFSWLFVYPTTIIIGDLSKNQFDTLWLSGGNSHTKHSDMTKGTSPESWTPRLGNRVYLRLIDLIPFFWRLLENRLFSGTSFTELFFNLKFKMQFGRF